MARHRMCPSRRDRPDDRRAQGRRRHVARTVRALRRPSAARGAVSRGQLLRSRAGAQQRAARARRRFRRAGSSAAPAGGARMTSWPRPAEGTWTEHYPELGTGPISFRDCVSPEFYELERDGIFRRAWLNVGRVEDLPRLGSYFTKEIHIAGVSVIVARGKDDEIRAFHNVCRHRGNKLVW